MTKNLGGTPDKLLVLFCVLLYPASFLIQILKKGLSKKERDGQKSHDKMHNTVRTGFGISKKKAPDSTKFFQEFKKN